MTIELNQAIALGDFVSKQTYFLWLGAIALTLVELNMLRHTNQQVGQRDKRKQVQRIVWSCTTSIALFSASLIAGFVANLSIISVVENAGKPKAAELFASVELFFVFQALLFALGLAIFVIISLANPRALTVAVTEMAGGRNPE